ncbi:hypothetical protein TCAL_01600 [Tigriopus californicus]|uniref:Origin recognition complex subunit 1 n=1 Tax=Tigriopus californicus TaxID=6832 RepID=A0A553PAA3_TIGCA|nr:origin recognition complex subunit 1-like [Tigriopus californicus]TRY74610.1 hypothetical protein TCAL_01600 [Tigriopus californicus]|eukprot:TCALIF_01600-PA protein Name:"Similar to ORC1 Origin recognition complex subunit 1 (Cricetulus griseus)" AED:0.00 eAED:0.00 QI:155/1/1/1/1/1/2/161/707
MSHHEAHLTESCLLNQPQVLLKRSFGADLTLGLAKSPQRPPKTSRPDSRSDSDSEPGPGGHFTFYAQATESPTKIHIKRLKMSKENRRPSRRCFLATPKLSVLPEVSTLHQESRSVGQPPTHSRANGTIDIHITPKKRGRPPKNTPVKTPKPKSSTSPTVKIPKTRTPCKTPKNETLAMETKMSTPRRTSQRNVASTPKSQTRSGLRTTPRVKTTPMKTIRTPSRAKKSLKYTNDGLSRHESESDEDDEPSDIDLDDDIEDEDFDPRKVETRKMAKWSDSEDDFDTPRKRDKRRAFINQTPVAKTPKSIRKRIMTPKMPKRAISLSSDLSPIQEAQIRLHVSAVPDSLPCRENEFAEIFSFTEAKIQEGTGGCMYISGWPGTGKTATVMEVVRTLESAVAQGELEDFRFIELNAMRLTEPNQAYVQLWKKLTGERVTSDHAMALLERRFSGENRQTTVLLIDELDMLCNRRQSVLYNLFDWPTRSSSKLVVLAIANAMDLPERVMINRVSSRLGLTRLTFSPYTFQQLQEIVSTRLAGLKIFDKNALQIVSRKVASLSGDARRALDICRRATEIAQRDSNTNSSVLVEISHVLAAHEEMFCSPKIVAIRSCSTYEKMFLRGIVQAFQKSGLEETQFERVFLNLREQLNYENLPMINVTQAYAIANRLGACKLVISEPGRLGIHLRIRLNVSQDDVVFALDSGKVKDN